MQFSVESLETSAKTNIFISISIQSIFYLFRFSCCVCMRVSLEPCRTDNWRYWIYYTCWLVVRSVFRVEIEIVRSYHFRGGAANLENFHEPWNFCDASINFQSSFSIDMRLHKWRGKMKRNSMKCLCVSDLQNGNGEVAGQRFSLGNTIEYGVINQTKNHNYSF